MGTLTNRPHKSPATKTISRAASFAIKTPTITAAPASIKNKGRAIWRNLAATRSSRFRATPRNVPGRPDATPYTRSRSPMTKALNLVPGVPVGTAFPRASWSEATDCSLALPPGSLISPLFPSRTMIDTPAPEGSSSSPEHPGHLGVQQRDLTSSRSLFILGPGRFCPQPGRASPLPGCRRFRGEAEHEMLGRPEAGSGVPSSVALPRHCASRPAAFACSAPCTPWPG